MKKITMFLAALAAAMPLMAQTKVSIHEEAENQPIIPAEIYGQFSEHLGRCIYEGIWVGKDSPIPNTDGYRNDILQALIDLKVPVLRWPGGCFADEYHWMDGIGPQESRRKIVNTNWGGTLEDNSFGTHEFFNLCELIGAEPYLSANVGSGTVEEMAKWIEYITAKEGSMAELRAQNGRKEPWHLKYLGVGNESWGCGGNMHAQYYADVYRRYSLYARNFNGNRLYKVACGASDYNYDWTKVLMDQARNTMDGLSLHYYTVHKWDEKGSATEFNEDEYYNCITKACEVEEVLRNHIDVMDAYDKKGRVGLILDEWGTWFDVEPGTKGGWLYQQNTMRDAIVAGLSLNIFNKMTRRLQMANIAQMVNVLQAMALTDGDRMLLTPTYHVFRMYNVHQDALFVPSDYKAGEIVSETGRRCADLSVSTSRDRHGVLHVSIVNPSLAKAKKLTLAFDKLKPASVEGEILATDDIHDHNTFENSELVAPKAFDGAKIKGRNINLTIPAASVIVLEIK